MRVPAGRSVQEIDSAQFGFYSPRRQNGRPSLVLVFLNGGFRSDVANTRIRAKDLITSFKFSDDIPDAERLCIERLAKQKLSEDVELSGHDSDADFLNPLSSASEPPGVFQDLD